MHSSLSKIGPNNPAWVNRKDRYCSCGVEKSRKAKKCRTCSFKSGSHTGKNNGRYIHKNRKQYLDMLNCAKIARTALRNALTSLGVKKTIKSEKLLGYSFKQFKVHIESQFKPGMYWSNKNRRKWHLDHILPVNFFVHSNIDDISLINALWNLKPMWGTLNIKKSATITQNEIDYLDTCFKLGKITEFNYNLIKSNLKSYRGVKMNTFNEIREELENDGFYIKLTTPRKQNAHNMKASTDNQTVQRMDDTNFFVVKDELKNGYFFIRGDFAKPLFTTVANFNNLMVIHYGHFTYPEYHPNSPYFFVEGL